MRPYPLSLFLLLPFLLVFTACAAPDQMTDSAPAMEACLLAGGVNAQCGTLAVPENREVPDGRMIDIYFAKIPAESSISEPDPVFMLAGGPGQAATEVYPAVLTAMDTLRQNRDIVLVDQRGTGKSNPLDCPDLQELALDSSEEEVLAVLEACRQTLAERAELDQYTTDVAMQDLDAVRQALGYERINLIGVSYGTRAALTYMRLFPDNVRSVVLDAVVSSQLVLQLQAPVDGQRALEQLFARCQADVACRTAFPDFQSTFEEVQQALDNGREVTMQHPSSGEWEQLTLDDEEWMQSVFNLLYSPELVSLLPLMVENIEDTGDYGPFLAQVVALVADLRSYQGMFYAVTCSEDAPFIDLQAAEEMQESSSFPLVADEFVVRCQNWPRAEVPRGLRERLNSDIPTLLLSGEADPITPPRYAQQVAAGLSNSASITLPDYRHGVLFVGCLPSVVTDFIETGAVDNLDTSCVEEITPPPFFVSPTGPQP